VIAAAYGTVSDIEILWVLVALVGCIYSVFNIRASQRDFDWLNENKIENGRRTLARYQLLAELLRAATQTIFLTIGVLAGFLPEPPPVPLTHIQSIVGFAARWGFITASVFLTIKSYLGYRVRQVLQGR
jgi:hypothetical protein